MQLFTHHIQVLDASIDSLRPVFKCVPLYMRIHCLMQERLHDVRTIISLLYTHFGLQCYIFISKPILYVFKYTLISSIILNWVQK